MKKALSISVIMIFFFIRSSAQWGVGLDVSYKVHTNGLLNNPSIGLCYYNFFLHSQVFYYADLGFGFAKTQQGSVTALANNVNNPLQQINVGYDMRYKTTYVNFGVGKIFKSDYDSGGFLAYAGITTLGVNLKTKLDAYNENDYSVVANSEYKKNDIFFGYGLKFGVGYLFRFGSFGATPTIDVALPLLIDNRDVVSVFFAFGVRFCFYT